MRVLASRPRPGAFVLSDFPVGSGLGGDKVADGIEGVLAPDQEGDIAALAATVPGVTLTPGGIEAFGTGAEQTVTTLNGLTFGGGTLPRDATTSVRVQASPWDPARGGFGGALVATTVAPGGRFAQRRARVSVDAPALQFAAGAPRAGQEFSNVVASVGGSGELYPTRSSTTRARSSRAAGAARRRCSTSTPRRSRVAAWRRTPRAGCSMCSTRTASRRPVRARPTIA